MFVVKSYKGFIKNTIHRGVTMKIEIWSDIVCPFCYLGKYYLSEALEKFSVEEEVDIIWCSFELDSRAPKDPDGDIYKLLAAKYRQTRNWAIEANKKLKKKASEIGLAYNPEKIIPTNSFDAHRLIKLATKYGLAGNAQQQLFKAYFVEGKHIGRNDILKDIGENIGLDGEVLDELFGSDAFTDEVRADEWEANKMGIQGVPYFLFERKYAISGAQPTNIFLDILRKCSNENYLKPTGKSGI